MDQERLQENLAGEALALLAHGCGDAGVAKYEQAIRFIGSAWDIPEDTTSKVLNIIEQGKETPEKLQSGEITLGNQKDFMANWTAYDTFWVLMDLFLASTRMATEEDRTTLYSLADEIIGTQNFEEWLSQKQ